MNRDQPYEMQVKNRNLFRLNRFILLKLPLLLQLLAKFRKSEKKILVIKTDAIGDYVLFRNFLQELKNDDLYSNYQIDLLGNELWQEASLLYDKAYISNFYFINASKFYERPGLVLKLGWKLFCGNYAYVLQPSYTRTFINDGLAALTAGKTIIGFKGDTEAIVKKLKTKTDRFYHRLIHLPENVYFEFDRTRLFFETFLNHPICLNGPSLPVKKEAKNYIAFCLGAGNVKRGWPAKNFLSLAQFILINTSYEVCLLGGPEAAEDAAFIQNGLASERVKNYCQQTTIPEFVNYIAQSVLVICNETSPAHIASACGKQTVSILGGGHFRRFAPYPGHLANRPTFIFEKMPCYYCNWLCKYETSLEEPFPCISIVNLNAVWTAVLQQLNLGASSTD